MFLPPSLFLLTVFLTVYNNLLVLSLQDMPLMSLDYGFLVMRVSLLSLIGKFGLFDFLTYQCSNMS